MADKDNGHQETCFAFASFVSFKHRSRKLKTASYNEDGSAFGPSQNQTVLSDSSPVSPSFPSFPAPASFLMRDDWYSLQFLDENLVH